MLFKKKEQKKYEFTSEFVELLDGRKLFRIKALVKIERFGIEIGDLGGYIEKEENLSHFDDAWVFDNARVSDDARVSGNARVFDNAWVYGNAWVSGNARVFDNARVFGNARVSDDVRVSGNAWVFDNAWVYGNAWVSGDAWVSGYARVFDNADYLYIHGLGMEHRTTTAFKCKDKMVRIKCGCFYGTIEEFRKQVVDTREGKVVKEYLAFADLLEIYFEADGGKEQ